MNGLNLLGGSSIGLGNMLTTALLAELIQRKINVDQLLERSRHVFWFVGLILPIPIISATIGVTVLYLTGITPLSITAPVGGPGACLEFIWDFNCHPSHGGLAPQGLHRLRPEWPTDGRSPADGGAIVAIYALSFSANTQLWHLLIPDCGLVSLSVWPQGYHAADCLDLDPGGDPNCP
jgi:hypothetical protein